MRRKTKTVMEQMNAEKADEVLADIEAKHGSQHRLVRRLCAGIVHEAINKGWGDIHHESWNPDAHVELTLTVRDVRLAAKIIGYKASSDDIEKGKSAREWAEYIEALDSGDDE